MGHHSKNLTSSTKRRFVLADKIAPKADHAVELTESSSFGNGTPMVRKMGQVEQIAPEDGLQDSIKSILAKFE